MTQSTDLLVRRNSDRIIPPFFSCFTVSLLLVVVGSQALPSARHTNQTAPALQVPLLFPELQHNRHIFVCATVPLVASTVSTSNKWRNSRNRAAPIGDGDHQVFARSRKSSSKAAAATATDGFLYGYINCPNFLSARIARREGCSTFPFSSSLSSAVGRADTKAPATAATVSRGRGSSSSSQRHFSSVKMLGAWRCSGSSNGELVKNLIDSSLIRSPRVAKVMQATDRGFYVAQEAYEDRPQPIGFRATISAPHMHAHALEVLSPVVPQDGGKVLDVGCGSGYLTAALARMVGTGGVCYGMDYIANLVALSEANLDGDDAQLLGSGNVRLKTGDGWKGWAEYGPFDAIHVGAAAERIPEELVQQLKPGGRMVVPVGPATGSQVLVQVDRTKDDGPIAESYTTENLLSVIYVPLVSTAS